VTLTPSQITGVDYWGKRVIVESLPTTSLWVSHIREYLPVDHKLSKWQGRERRISTFSMCQQRLWKTREYKKNIKGMEEAELGSV